MNILKQILNYLIWTSISFLFAFSYTRMLLGSKRKESINYWHLFDVIYDLALYHLGFIIGCVIAFLFILIDFFYLKKKFKTNSKRFFIRFLAFILITLIVIDTHYLSEKIIDII